MVKFLFLVPFLKPSIHVCMFVDYAQQNPCTKLDQTFRGCCVGAGDFYPPGTHLGGSWGIFFGQAIFGEQRAIS